MSESATQPVLLGEVRSSANRSDCRPPVQPRPLVECVYISVVCAPCECVRVAVAEPPREEMIACPACGRPSTWGVLARGATVRPLPFYQRMRLGEDRKGQSRVPWTIYESYDGPADATKEEPDD